MSSTDFLDAPRVFVRVYKLPRELTRGYCFGGGVIIPFTNVDWFETLLTEGSTKELIEFIKGKKYFDPKARFLVLGDHPNFVFTIEPEVK